MDTHVAADGDAGEQSELSFNHDGWSHLAAAPWLGSGWAAAAAFAWAVFAEAAGGGATKEASCGAAGGHAGRFANTAGPGAASRLPLAAAEAVCAGLIAAAWNAGGRFAAARRGAAAYGDAYLRMKLAVSFDFCVNFQRATRAKRPKILGALRAQRLSPR